MQYDVYPSPHMVVPLAVTAITRAELPHRLCPVFTFQGQHLMRVPFEAAPLDKRLLKTQVGTVRERSHDVVAAIYAVMSGL